MAARAKLLCPQFSCFHYIISGRGSTSIVGGKDMAWYIALVCFTLSGNTFAASCYCILVTLWLVVQPQLAVEGGASGGLSYVKWQYG